MADGIFHRFNSAMLRSSSPGPIFSLVGTVDSCDGRSLVIQASDKGKVVFDIDPSFIVPALGLVVEIMGVKSGERTVAFIAREIGPSDGFDMELYNDMITQVMTKFPEPFLV